MTPKMVQGTALGVIWSPGQTAILRRGDPSFLGIATRDHQERYETLAFWSPSWQNRVREPAFAFVDDTGSASVKDQPPV